MKIRLKLITLLAGIFLVLGLAEIQVEKRIVMPSFAELERTGAHTAMQRIDSALKQLIDRIAISATEWGNWDETYRYVVVRSPEFLTAERHRHRAAAARYQRDAARDQRRSHHHGARP